MSHKRTIKWNLYKTTGKWAYGGEAEISAENFYFNHDELLADIEANQKEVCKGTITKRSLIFVVDGDKDNPNHDHPFITRLFPPKEREKNES